MFGITNYFTRIVNVILSSLSDAWSNETGKMIGLPLLIVVTYYLLEAVIINPLVHTNPYFTKTMIGLIFFFPILYQFSIVFQLHTSVKFSGRITSLLREISNAAIIYAVLFGGFWLLIAALLLYFNTSNPIAFSIAITYSEFGIIYLSLYPIMRSLVIPYDDKLISSLKTQIKTELDDITEKYELENVLNDLYVLVSYNNERSLPSKVKLLNSDSIRYFSYLNTQEKKVLLKKLNLYVDRMISNYENLPINELVLEQQTELSYIKLVREPIQNKLYEITKRLLQPYEKYVALVFFIILLFILQRIFNVPIYDTLVNIYSAFKS